MALYTREPGTLSREQVIGYSGPSTTNEQLETLTYCQIVAETGDTDAIVISKLYDLLSNFTYDKELKIGMPKCFLEAAFLVSHSPILVRRIAPTDKSKLSVLTVLDAEDNELFKITHKYPNSKDILSINIKLKEAGSQLFDITLNTLNSQGEISYTETYTLSTDVNSTSSTGLSNGIDILNEYRNDITVEVLSVGVPSKIKSTSNTTGATITTTAIATPIAFGAYQSSDAVNPVTAYMDGTADIAEQWKDAIAELSELEVPHPAMMFSSTIPYSPKTNQLQVDKCIMEEAQSVKSWPIMNPYIPTADGYAYTQIQSIGSTYAANDALGNLVLPGFFDTTLLGRKVLFGGGLDYHRTVCNNFATSKGFAPIMGTSGNGTSSARNNLAAFYKKSERLALLNSGVTVIRYNKVKDLAYYVMNNSLNITDDSISEEQNRRLMNKVATDIDQILEDYVGKYNTAETRDRVEEAISNYERFTLSVMSYKHAELQVKCDSDINGPGIINSNRLEVEVGIRFNRATRFVNILYKILPVASE